MDMNRPMGRAYGLFRDFQPLHSIIHYYVDLSCFLVTLGDFPDWWALNRRKRVTSFHDMEIRYRTVEARDRFLRGCVGKMRAGGKTVCGERLGFSDLFVPVADRAGGLMGYLQAGAFRKEEVTSGVIADCWKRLTGLKPSPHLAEFREFVRVLLEIPVLDGPLFPAFQESLELFAGVLADGEEGAGAGKRVRELFLKVFSKRMPHSYWLDWALGRATSESVPVWSRRMENWGWTKDEIGLDRVPTTVMTLVPRDLHRPGLDWTEEMVRIYRFQRRCFDLGRTLPQTVGGKLDDYGAVFVTSADPRLPRLAQRRVLGNMARKIHDFAVQEMGGPVLMAVGESTAPGAVLHQSYRQAVLALYANQDRDQDILFLSGGERSGTSGGFEELRGLLEGMNSSFSRASFSGLEAVREAFIAQAIHVSFSAPQEIRWHFRYALDRLSETAGDRIDFNKKEAALLRSEIHRKLDEAVTLQEMVQEFKEALGLLVERIERPKTLKESHTIGKVREYLDLNFRKNVPLASLSRMAGVSPSTLSRRFQRSVGMGLESYLQKRRLEEAKRLLRSTSLPVAKVAFDCGFRSASPFTRFFRKKTGTTPQAFRKRSLKV